MKKRIFLITLGLVIIGIAIFGIATKLSARPKTELAPQCIIENVENYYIKDASYNFTKLDGMIKKYEIKVNGVLTFYLDGEKMENNEEHYFHTSDDDFFNNIKKNSDQYGLYKVTVSINNRLNEKMFDIDWKLDSERHAVIETDFTVEGKSVDTKKEEQFILVVLIDDPDMSDEQVKDLLISSGLKTIYRTLETLEKANGYGYQEIYLTSKQRDSVTDN